MSAAGTVAALWSVFVLVGCGPGPTASVGPETAAREEPQYGGVFRIPDRASAFISRDPYQGGVNSERALKGRPVYEPLVTYRFEHGTDYRNKSEVVPWLAEKWEQRTPAEYVFTLNKDAKWQDGRELTAEDVVYTVRRVLDPERKYSLRADWLDIKEVAAEGEYQVRISLKTPNPEFLGERLTDKPILPRHLEDRGQDIDKVAIGTGAFKMVTMDNQKGLTFERNPNYWQSGLPYLDGIVVYKGLDDSGLLAALNTGQIDVYNPDNPTTAEQLRSMVPGLGTLQYSYINNNTVFMHLDRPPFNDLRIRKALHLGLDRQKLIALGLAGKGNLVGPGSQPGSPDALSNDELITIPGLNPTTKAQDIREARRLLDEVGFPLTSKLKLAYSLSQPSSKALAEPLVTLWMQELGLQLELEPLESATFESRRIAGDYQLVMAPPGLPALRSYNQFYKSGGIYTKGYGGGDPDLDRLIEAAEGEASLDKRRDFYRQVQRAVYEKLPGIVLVEPIGFATWQPWLKNYFTNAGAQVIPFYTPPTTWIDRSLLPEARKSEKLPF